MRNGDQQEAGGAGGRAAGVAAGWAVARGDDDGRWAVMHTLPWKTRAMAEIYPFPISFDKVKTVFRQNDPLGRMPPGREEIIVYGPRKCGYKKMEFGRNRGLGFRMHGFASPDSS